MFFKAFSHDTQGIIIQPDADESVMNKFFPGRVTIDYENPITFTDNIFHAIGTYIDDEIYNIQSLDVFEVKTDKYETCSEDEHLFFSNKLLLVRKLTIGEIFNLCKSRIDIDAGSDNHYIIHGICVMNIDWFIEKIISVNKNSNVKKQLIDTKLPFVLSSYKNDPDYTVRMCVAMITKTFSILDELVNDPEPFVRISVAERRIGSYLDILVNDPNWMVRCAVVRSGFNKYLDMLVRDPDWMVRREVVLFGRDDDLKILIKDENLIVSELAAQIKINKFNPQK